MLEYLRTARERPVWRPVPAEVHARLSGPAPRQPAAAADVYEEFKRDVLPYPTGNIHPRFWGWVIGTGTPVGMLADMLASGELVAAIGVEIDHPDVKPLIPDALDAGLAALRRDGHYPINHAVVIKDELIAKYPDLAADVFNAFAESKRLYVDRLRAGAIENPTAVDKVHQKVMEIAGEPLPYGVAPNRRVIEELIGHALKQGIITKPVTVDELFAPSTRSLAG